MKNFLRFLLVVSAISVLSSEANAQNVGIGTVNPAQKLEIAGNANTMRIGGLAAGGAFIGAPTASTDQVLFVTATGDIKAITAGTVGTILSLNSLGVPTWANSAAAVIGAAGEVLYGTGTGSAFTTGGTTGQVLQYNATGVPTWVNASALLPTGTYTQTVYYNASNVLTATSSLTNDGLGDVVITQAAQTATPMATALTVTGGAISTGSPLEPDVYFNLNRVITESNGPGVNPGRGLYITAPQFAKSLPIIPALTTASTVDIAGAPTAAAVNPLTITNAYALNVETGTVGIGSIGTGGANNSAATITGGNIAYAVGATGKLFSLPAVNSAILMTSATGVPSWSTAATSIAWLLTGNATGTYTASAAPTTYLGTTAAGGTGFQFGVAGVNAGRLESANFGNTAFGYQSLNSTTGTVADVAIGYKALSGNAGGSFNTAVGYLAFGNPGASGGSNNTGIGYQALLNNTGSNNTSVGYGTLNSTLSGNGNTAIGRSALNVVTTAGSNVGVGTNAGATITTGSRNVALGDSTLFTNTTGANNTAVGYQANVSANNLTFATAIGSGATAVASSSVTLGSASAGTLYLPGYGTVGSMFYTSNANGLVTSTGAGTTGQVLTVVGGVPTWQAPAATSSTAWQLLGNSGTTYGTNYIGTNTDQGLMFKINSGIAGRVEDATSGKSATSLGYKALNVNTGIQNVALGDSALAVNTTGAYNTAVGYQALGSNTVAAGSFNTALGNEALNGSTTGSHNLAVGYLAMNTAQWSQVNTGTYNIGIGENALDFLSTGSENIGIGQQTLYNNDIGNDNISIGDFSLNTSDGNNNIAIGYQSGFNMTSGSNNTAMGYNSLYLGNDNSDVAIGAYTLGSEGFLPSTGTFGDVAVGYGAARNLSGSGNTSSNGAGNANTVIGYQAMLGTPIGNFATANTVVGYKAFYNSDQNSFNTAIGDSSLYNAGGNNEVAIGYGALSNDFTGFNNTTVGYLANVGVDGLINATAIGANAIVNNDSTIQLGKSANVSFDLALMPNGIAGTSGQYLKSNGAGAAPTWVTPTTGTVTSVTANLPLSVTNPTTTPVISLIGTSGTILYGTGAASAFQTAAGVAGNVLLSGGAGAPTWLANGTAGQVLTVTGGVPTWSTPTVAAPAWQLLGNNGVTYATNFIGTVSGTDQALKLEVNGLTAGRIEDINMANGAYGNTSVGYLALSTATTNFSSSAFGKEALRNSTANLNTAIGDSSLASTTTGTKNTAVGYQTLATNTTGASNVAIGRASLLNSTVSKTVAVGDSALAGNTTGTFNTALGYQALTKNTTATTNTSVGYQSLSKNITGSSNTAVGYQSLLDNTGTNSAGQQTAIGYQALALNASGGANVAVGYLADGSGFGTTTDSANVAVGNFSNGGAAVPTTGKFGNVAVGYQAAQNLAGGGSRSAIAGGNANTAVGYEALYGSGIGNFAMENTAIGFMSQFNSTQNSGNTSLGDSALYGSGSGTGTNNVAVGYKSLVSNSGTSNVAIGDSVGFGNVRGSYNVLLGHAALRLQGSTGTLATGGRSGGNIGIGYEAGYYVNSVNFARAVLVGYESGFSAISSNAPAPASGTLPYYGNTEIGYQAGFSSTTLASAANVETTVPVQTGAAGIFNTFIGYQAGFSNAYNGTATANDNTFMGYGAGWNAQAASGVNESDNTIIGYNPNVVNASGASTYYNASQGTFVGSGAGNATTTGGNNTFIGYNSGSANTTGSNNTALGNSTSVGTNLSNATAVGYQATAVSSNSVTLGNNVASLYLPGDNAVGSMFYTAAASGLVSPLTVGTTGQVLTVTGGVPTWSTPTVSAPAWQLLGNTGTTYGTNFHGTTDDQSLLFKVFGSTAGRIEDLNAANSAYANTSIGYLALNSAGTAYSNVAIGKEALRNTTTGGDRNAAVGDSALATNTTGTANVALGYQASAISTSASNNIAIGNGALSGETNGVGQNVAIGTSALALNNSSRNIAIGYDALDQSTTGGASSSIAIGYLALSGQTTGTRNMGMGYTALSGNTTGSFNTAIGNFTLVGGSGSDNTSLGYGAGNDATQGNDNTFLGYNPNAAQQTFGGAAINGNTAVGSGAIGNANNNGAINFNTAVGFDALFNNTTFSLGSAQSDVAIGYQSLYSNGGETNNVAVGYNALYNTANPLAVTGNNSALGYQSLYGNTTGTNNIGIGYQAGYTATPANANTTGSNNTFIGYNSGPGTATQLSNATTLGNGALALVGNSVTLGNNAVNNLYLPGYAATGEMFYTSAASGLVSPLIVGTTGQVLTVTGGVPTWATPAATSSTAWQLVGNAVSYSYSATPATYLGTTAAGGTGFQFGVGGNNAGRVESTGGSTALGYQALNANTASGSTAMGYQAMMTNSSAAQNTAVGYQALKANNGTWNTAIGYQALLLSTGGIANVAVGDQTLDALTTGDFNVGMGYQTMESLQTGLGNTAIGYQALSLANGTSYNTAVGFQALGGLTTETGQRNTALGNSSMTYNTTGANNTSVGDRAVTENTTGNNNVGIGETALFNNTTGSNNVAIGYQSMFGTSVPISNNSANTAVGSNSLFGIRTGALNNVAIGDSSLYSNAGATNNTGVGWNSLTLNTGNQNTALGSSALATSTTGTGNTAVGYNANLGTATFSNATVIGANATAAAGNSVTLGTASAGALYLPGYGTVGSMFYTSAANGLVSPVAIGTAGQVLTVTGGVPTWSTPTVAAPAWQLLGNSGTTYGTNFHGTTDDQSLLFKVFGSTAGKIEDINTANGGYGNTSIGYLAASTGTTAYSNVAVGKEALRNSTANKLTAVGDSALAGNTTGTANIGIGYQAAFANLTGANNIAIGNSTLAANTTKSGNIAIGTNALAANIGANNIAIGLNALAVYNLANGNFTPNLAIGNSALAACDTFNNLAIGERALAVDTKGANNVAIGASALLSNSNSSQNTVVGYLALSELGQFSYTGKAGDNTVMGYNALSNDFSGVQNTVIGSQAMSSGNFMSQDVAIGYQAFMNAGGSPFSGPMNDVAIGYQAMFNNELQSGNIGIGYQAMYNTTAFTAIGNNTAIGTSVLYGNTSGVSNVAVGYQAGYTSVAGNANVTGSNNTYLGFNAGPGSPAQFNNSTAVGSYATVAQSNAVVLGSINGVNGATASAKVGIGTSTPAQALDVEGGNLQFGQALMPAGLAGSTGNVLLSAGAGTAPTWLSNGTTGQVLTVSGGVPTWQTPTVAAPSWQLSGNSGTTAGTNFIGTTDPTDFVVKTNSGERMRVTSTGNVGIGTPTPGQLLTVTQAADADKYVVSSSATQLTLTGHYQNVALYGYAKGGNNSHGFAVGAMGIADPGSEGGAALYGAFNTAAPALTLNNFYGLYVDATTTGPLPTYAAAFMNGNVGIGTNAPAQALDVEGGNLQFGEALMPAGNAGSTGNVLLSAGAATAPTWLANGTTGQILTMTGGAPTWASPAPTSSTAWQLTGNSGTTAGTNYIGTSDTKDLVFKTDGSEAMRITNGGGSNGSVGINTPTPNSTLQVNGSLALAINIVSAASYNATSNDYFIEGNCSSNSVTITLPDATTVPGRVYYLAVNNIAGSNIMTVNTFTGTQSIGTYGTSITLTNNYEQEYLISDGANWFVMGSSKM